MKKLLEKIERIKKAEQYVKKGDKTVNQVRAESVLSPLKENMGREKLINKE